MEQHLQPLLHIIHAQVIKRGPILSPSKFPVLESRCVQDVDGRTGFGTQLRLEGAIDEHDESIEGLFIQPHHEAVQVGGAIATNVGEKERASDGCGVTLIG